MPTTNEGLDQVEAVVSSDNSTNNAASSAGSVSAFLANRDFFRLVQTEKRLV